jgi:hypothetical protein
MAPAPVAAAPSVGQAPGIGQGPVSTALVTMVAPSLLESILGAIGNRLRQRGLPRMEVAQAPTVNTVPGNLALAPTAPAFAAAPAAYPQVGYMPVGPPYAAPPPAMAPPPEYAPPVPSAQGYAYPPAHSHKSGWFRR